MATLFGKVACISFLLPLLCHFFAIEASPIKIKEYQNELPAEIVPLETQSENVFSQTGPSVPSELEKNNGLRESESPANVPGELEKNGLPQTEVTAATAVPRESSGVPPTEFPLTNVPLETEEYTEEYSAEYNGEYTDLYSEEYSGEYEYLDTIGQINQQQPWYNYNDWPQTQQPIKWYNDYSPYELPRINGPYGNPSHSWNNPWPQNGPFYYPQPVDYNYATGTISWPQNGYPHTNGPFDYAQPINNDLIYPR